MFFIYLLKILEHTWTTHTRAYMYTYHSEVLRHNILHIMQTQMNIMHAIIHICQLTYLETQVYVTMTHANTHACHIIMHTCLTYNQLHSMPHSCRLICTNTYAHKNTHTCHCIRVLHTSKGIPCHILAGSYAQKHMHVHNHTCTRMYVRRHARVCTYTHACMRMHTYTHTHTLE